MRASLALLLLLAAAASARAGGATVFPRSGVLFNPLLADPREIQLSVAYYRLKGFDISDVGLGHSWGMARWRWGQADFQWDIEAMAMSRFKLDGSVNEFQTVDFFGNLPVEVRSGDNSARVMVFHQSSHLGDDYIRRTRDAGFRYSIDGLKAVLARDLWKRLRVYADGMVLLHSIPAPERGSFGFGFEATTPTLARINKDLPLNAYLAWDVQSRAHAAWNSDSNVQVGLRLRFRDQERSMRVFWAYFDGHSPYGEFYLQREHYSELGLAFDF